jgi:quinol monooxygenase YgiN
MWVQIIKAKLKDGMDAGLEELFELIKANEQPDSGLIRETMARDQNDPNTVYVIATFESEEQARAREADPRREQGQAAIRQKLGEMIAAPPEFIDLDVVDEFTL